MLQAGAVRRAMLGAVVGLLAVPAVALAAPSKPAPVGQGTQVVVGPQIGTASSQPPTSAQCAAATGGAVQACYGPPSIRAQYDFNPLYGGGTTGAGQTIVIFDSFGSPTIASDLAQFDSTYGIPAPPAFNIYQPEGTVHYLWTPGQPNSARNKNAQTQVGWAEETTLDVEWAHAIAPGANIALVETPNAETQGVQGLQNLENAQRWALQNHIGTIWSDSFATTEQAFHNPSAIQRLNSLYASARAQGVSAFFATGDTGVANADKQGRLFPYPTVNFPSSSPDIISVGGTEIPSPPPTIEAYQPEAAWNDCCGSGGGGFSSVFSEPDYQSSAQITDPSGMRGLPDVSYNAALVSAILTYESLPSGSGWLIIGGTSAATPQWAALDALANQADGSLGFLAPRLYQIYANTAEYTSAFHDITAGDNSFGGVTGYQAGAGWDAATGLGTPDAYRLVQALKNTIP